MNTATVIAAWALVTLDLALMGYRVEWGTSALLHKRRRHQRAALRVAALGQPAIALAVLVAGALHASGAARADALDAALRGFLSIAVPYAVVIVGASAALLVPSVDVRSAASVLVFGPLTLLRPLIVVAATVGAALVAPRHPDALVVALAAAVAIAGIALEVVLDRRAAARLLRDAAGSVESAAKL